MKKTPFVDGRATEADHKQKKQFTSVTANQWSQIKLFLDSNKQTDKPTGKTAIDKLVSVPLCANALDMLV